MAEVVKIDGSYGEGGGQILRTSLSLSIVTGKPFEIFNIRKGRKKPGLQAQHLTSVRAAKTISSASVSGDALGSTALSFTPKRALPGNYHFNVAEERGSAGSAMLVLQTILLPLSCADAESKITIEGGTHVPWSPPFHFIAETFASIIAKLGFSFSLAIEKWGWYPKGGGLVSANVSPWKKQDVPFYKENRGDLIGIRGISAVSNLPLSIAERQKKEALKILGEHGLDAEIATFQAPSIGAGSFLFLNARFKETFAGFSALGERGKRAEEVSSDAASELLAFLSTDATIDPHISDQIVLYLALSRGLHVFSTSAITQHLLTNIEVVERFIPEVRIRVNNELGQPGRITIDSTFL